MAAADDPFARILAADRGSGPTNPVERKAEEARRHAPISPTFDPKPLPAARRHGSLVLISRSLDRIATELEQIRSALAEMLLREWL